MDPSLHRIAVIGTSCCGKTTLARQLATVIGSKHIELDALHWGRNWTPVDASEFERRVDEAITDERWTLCGNYRRVRQRYLARATTVIWLNYPFPLIFWRALKRTTRRVVSGERLFAGNRETFRTGFVGRHSMLGWVLTSHLRRCRQNREVFARTDCPTLRRIEFRHPKEAVVFVRSLEKSSGG